jgi:RNA polymerase sigma-70 factor (ECF subfamily)
MAEKTPETSIETGDPAARAGEASFVSAVEDWFIREVLPLEAMLMHFLHQNWRNKADLEDFRQDIYAQLLEAAETQIPERTRPFVFATARNLLINRVRREHIVPIDAVADMESFGLAADEPGPDRSVIARDTLRKLQLALDRLPARAREAVVLRRIEGMSRREIAERMGITERTVADHIAHGMRILATALFCETPKEDA